MSRETHVVLVEPEIPGNTGSIGRTCLAVGAKLHLVRPLGFSLSESRVRRAGLDYWHRVDLEVWPSWEDFEKVLPTLGAPFFFTSEAEQVYWDVDYPDRTVLVFGKESVGLSEEIRERYRNHLVGIPIHDPQTRSLNLSVCVGLGLYELLRQEAPPPLERRGGS